MLKCSLFFVEGYDDSALVSEVLESCLNFKKITNAEIIEGEAKDLLEKVIPSNPTTKIFCVGQDKISIPVVFADSNYTHVVLIYIAGGLGTLNLEEPITTFERTRKNLESMDVCIRQVFFIDADQETVENRLEKFKEKLKQVKSICFDNDSSFSLNSEKKIGLFIFPNHCDSGIVEDLLLTIASTTFSSLFELTNTYIDNCRSTITEQDQYEKYKQKWDKSPSFDKKAKIGCISKILNPSKNLSQAIDKNWVNSTTLENVDDLKKLKDFLERFINLS